MLVRLVGIVTSVRLKQHWNADSPMLVTPVEMMAFVRLAQL